MSKKRIIIVLATIWILTFMSFGVFAADSNSSTQGANKAYDCLNDIIEDKTTSSISLQEAIFSTLALGSEKVLKDKIAEEKFDSIDCWPKDKCKIKETAQVGLAYKRISKSTDGIVDYLYSKNGTSNDLIWYLEIDVSNQETSECTLRYDGSERKIEILEDMTLSGNPGSCFTISGSGYFLQFKDSCYQKDIEISCDKDFITTLLYVKKTGETLYVLPETHSSSALGTTSEKVNVQCFKIDGKCNYEGSLWATLFLHKIGEEVDPFVPYLVALADDNLEFFPESFLYTLTGSDDQYSKIIQKQKQGRIWKMVGTPYNEFYDTSLAMLALSESEREATKTYLLSIQSANGCWNNNNIRDTAFLLYSGWPKSVVGDSGGSGTPLCTSVATQSCEIYNDCLDVGGRSLPNFECSGFNVCCSIKVPEKTCQEQEGTLCSANQRCEGSSADSSEEGVCCLGTCQLIEPEVEETCVGEGYSCQSSCLSGSEEETYSLTCSDGADVCCKTVDKKSYSWLIVLLVILIILIVLAIIYRDKLRFYWYKYKGEASSKPVVKPGMPPNEHMPQNPMVSRPQSNLNGNNIHQRPVMQQKPRAPPVQRNREFEDTLKKLREMSK